MSLTYDEILTKMKDEYYQKTMQKVENASDLLLRFEILATQLYSLSQMGDYILKQAFLQTATGQYLESHCEARGIRRKGNTKSIGKIRFCVNEPPKTNIQIPSGTICASSRNNLVRFTTTEDAVLESPKTFVDVEATALVAGTEYDAKSGEITVMIVPPSGIDSITNPDAFTGGYSGENDNMLRERAINSFKNMPNGKNKQDIIDRVYELQNVLDVNVYRATPGSDDQGPLKIAVRTVNDKLDPKEQALIIMNVADYMMYPYDIRVELATKVPLEYTLNLYIETGADKNAVVTNSKKVCKAFNENSRIGKVFSLFELGVEIEKIANIHHFAFETASGDKIFAPAENELIYSTSQEVVAYDW